MNAISQPLEVQPQSPVVGNSSKEICRALAISGGLSLFSSLVLILGQITSAEAAIHFALGSLVGHGLAIHMILSTQKRQRARRG